MRHLILNSLLACCLIGNMVAQEDDKNIIKDTYQDEWDGQTTVIIKDSTSTNDAILDQLDLDDYTVGQEVRITENMIAELNRRERMRALHNTPEESNGFEIMDEGFASPVSNSEGNSFEEGAGNSNEMNRHKGEGDDIFIQKQPVPQKFLNLIQTEEYQKKLKELMAKYPDKIFV